MRDLPYVRFDPTGNTTVFVTEPVDRSLQSGIAAGIMAGGKAPCEQVGFLEPASAAGARLRLQMMGGEFCGNALMSAASYTAWLDGLKPGQTVTVPIEISGAEGVLNCTVRSVPGGFEGTVPMPAVNAVEEKSGMTFVHMDGILHAVIRGRLPDAEAETFLRSLAENAAEDAAGLLQWADGVMVPLVLVKSTGTLVWETGCGSGSAAIGACEALRSGVGITETAVRQPGGTITVRAENKNGRIGSITVTGRVKMLESGHLRV